MGVRCIVCGKTVRWRGRVLYDRHVKCGAPPKPKRKPKKPKGR